MNETGVNYPVREGRRSSAETGKRICADAVRDLAPDVAAGIEGETDWRHGYARHIVAMTEVEARSGEAALQVASAGLASAYEQFVFVTDDGDQPLRAAIETDDSFETAKVTGTGAHGGTLTVPYRGRELSGSDLLRQLDDWVARGITEPSFAEAVGAVARNPDWLDLSDQVFALVGASAQMGPLEQLLAWGAGVAAIDRPGPDKWERMIATAKSSPGFLLVPVRNTTEDVAAAAGADLITQPGPIERWLERVPGPLTLGNYGYADGAAFPRLTMAFDVVCTTLTERRTDMSLAYLATPSDVFLVPKSAVEMAARSYERLRPTLLAARAIHRVSGGRYLRPNYSLDAQAVGNFGLVNAIIVEQGPNYVVAKRLQRWGMIKARADGLRTSVHVAPPTQTQSVHSNPAMKERQELTASIGIETFDGPASRALAAAILVHDLRNPSAPANPAVPMAHPHEIFMFAANPGGRWRVPLEPTSALPVISLLKSGRSRVTSLLRASRNRGADEDR